MTSHCQAESMWRRHSRSLRVRGEITCAFGPNRAFTHVLQSRDRKGADTAVESFGQLIVPRP